MINNLINHNFIKKYHLFLLLFFFIVSRLIIHNFLQIRISDPTYGYHLLHEDLLKNEGLIKEGTLQDLDNITLNHHINQSLRAINLFTLILIGLPLIMTREDFNKKKQ